MLTSSRRNQLQRKCVFELLGAAHPGFGAYRLHPIRKRWNESEVFPDMLLAYTAGRDDPAGRERNRATENGLRHEDALGVVPQRPVAEIGDDFFRLVEPVV